MASDREFDEIEAMRLHDDEQLLTRIGNLTMDPDTMHEMGALADLLEPVGLPKQDDVAEFFMSITPAQVTGLMAYAKLGRNVFDRHWHDDASDEATPNA